MILESIPIKDLTLDQIALVQRGLRGRMEDIQRQLDRLEREVAARSPTGLLFDQIPLL